MCCCCNEEDFKITEFRMVNEKPMTLTAFRNRAGSKSSCKYENREQTREDFENNYEIVLYGPPVPFLPPQPQTIDRGESKCIPGNCLQCCYKIDTFVEHMVIKSSWGYVFNSRTCPRLVAGQKQSKLMVRSAVCVVAIAGRHALSAQWKCTHTLWSISVVVLCHSIVFS